MKPICSMNEWRKKIVTTAMLPICVCNYTTSSHCFILAFISSPLHSTPSSLWWNINSFIYKRFLFCVFSKHKHTHTLFWIRTIWRNKIEREREEKVKWLLCIIERNFFFFFFAQKSLIDGGVRCCRRKMIYMITKNSVAYVNV